MKRRRLRPHWPILSRAPSTPEGEIDPKISRVTAALLDEYRAQGEKVGYDPYDASEPVKSPQPPRRSQRSRR